MSGLSGSMAGGGSSGSAGPRKRSQAEGWTGWDRLALLVPCEEALLGEKDGASASGDFPHSCP